MPWSEWQAPIEETAPRGPAKIATTSSSDTQVADMPGDPATQLGAARDAASSGAGDSFFTEIVSPSAAQTYQWGQAWSAPYGPDPTKAVGQANAEWRMWFYGLRPNAEARDAFPDALASLEEGVDFAVRPDRDGSERDAYVEYEDGLVFIQPSDIVRWDGSVTLAVAGEHDGAVVDNLSASAAISYEPFVPSGLYYQDGIYGWLPREDVGERLAPGYLPDPGAVNIATLSYVESGTSITETFYTDAARAFFTVVADSAWTFPTSGGSVPGNYTVTVDPRLAVTWTVRSPRWRYWIPGPHDFPLRQRQRDDGLGLSTARWRRGRSRQLSNRWRGYL